MEAVSNCSILQNKVTDILLASKLFLWFFPHTIPVADMQIL